MVTRSRDYEDVFSKQFERYLQLRNGKATPAKADTNLIIDALSMMYLGRIADNATGEIPITLNKTSGLTQNIIRFLVLSLVQPKKKMTLTSNT